MPRTTKEVKDENVENKAKKKASTVAKKETKKTATTKKASTTSKAKKETAAKKATTKKTAVKKTTTTTKKPAVKKEVVEKETKKPVAKKTATTKKASSTSKAKKETAAKKTTTKKTTAKKATATKKVAAKKSSTKKASSKKNVDVIDVLEYYDLPYRYNQTIVRVLAQTPKTLFVYWDISDSDRKSYVDHYGENFFDITKPVLIIHNETMNYSFEIDINDFANCWYFNINDEKCEYRVELGRRPKNNQIHFPDNYLFITSSNEMESPNGHILFEKEQKTLYYRNVKTDEILEKDVASLDYMRRLGRIYKIYDIYKELYKDDEFLTAGNPSSKFI